MHLTNAHDGATNAVAWILAALCLIFVIEAVGVAILIAAKRKARAVDCRPHPDLDDERQPAEVTA